MSRRGISCCVIEGAIPSHSRRSVRTQDRRSAGARFKSRNITWIEVGCRDLGGTNSNQTGIIPILVSSSNTTLTPSPFPNIPSLSFIDRHRTLWPKRCAPCRDPDGCWPPTATTGQIGPELPVKSFPNRNMVLISPLGKNLTVYRLNQHSFVRSFALDLPLSTPVFPLLP